MIRLRRNSVAERIAAFFRDNPDEELTFEDIAVKFSCTKQNASMAISRIADDGMNIESVRVVRMKHMGMARDPEPK